MASATLTNGRTGMDKERDATPAGLTSRKGLFGAEQRKRPTMTQDEIGKFLRAVESGDRIVVSYGGVNLHTEVLEVRTDGRIVLLPGSQDLFFVHGQWKFRDHGGNGFSSPIIRVERRD